MSHKNQTAPIDLSWLYVDDENKLQRAADQLFAGHGPVGLDVERASGYTYSQRAYLIQVHRQDAGTFLFDPLALETLAPLAEAIAGEEWILHAAHSDLDSLADAGLVPTKLYDTELASRLLGFEKVGLGAISDTLLATPLEKAFSRADWSTRPLPDPWLKYAALDVVLLPDLREATHQLLLESDKDRYAREEFESLLHKPPKEADLEPWRRLSGFGKLRSPKLKTIAKELWIARDSFAKSHDLAPTRVLPNSAIISAALLDPRSPQELAKHSEFTGKYSRTELERWWRAIKRAKITAPIKETLKLDLDINTSMVAPTNIRSWEKKNPAAYRRLMAARQLLLEASERLNIPPENILSPSAIKSLSWNPPDEISSFTISETLSESGARAWQRELTSQLIADSFVELL
ncbi:MAG TPA: HRDC domain-containing protein [Microbacteriaceae bacterium]|nr:HRDC domain-containing protein [Microbacteriaceae bacterium]